MTEFWADIWEMAKQAGAFAALFSLIICYLINEERKSLIERNIKLSDERNEVQVALLERTLKGLNDVNGTVKDLANLLRAVGDRR